MKKVTLKIILSLILCSLFIALMLSGVAVSQSKRVMQDEVKKELLYASQKYANQFSTEFKTQENVVDLICTVVSANLKVSEYQEDRAGFLKLEMKLNEIIKGAMKNIPETQSLYFTFNPETSGGNDEIWYLRNDKGEVFYKAADNTAQDWLIDNGSVTDAYYFDAIKYGKNWGGVEYDMYLDNYSVTYSRACLDKDGQLIGVMGSDIFINNIFNTVKNIQLEEGGVAFLMDSGYTYLAGSKPEALFYEMRKDGLLVLKNNISDKNNFSYTTVNGERYLTVYAKTSNGWILALIQSEKALLKPTAAMISMIYTMAFLILIGVIVYTFYFFKKSLVPIVKEIEEKDIIMLHQSRQAKLGEMVGNIAHQWKQPLNVMSITLSLIWDEYLNNNLDKTHLKDHIDKLKGSIRIMSSTADDFADFLKPSRKKEQFCVPTAVDIALDLMKESIKINRISVKKDAEEDCITCGYKNEFCQAIFNILNNARDAIIESDPIKREIKIRIYHLSDAMSQEFIVIDIANSGRQIPKDILNQVFLPHFTTKEGKGGTGIGLYLTKDIVESHMNGSIELSNVEDGVLCRIRVPRGGNE